MQVEKNQMHKMTDLISFEQLWLCRYYTTKIRIFFILSFSVCPESNSFSQQVLAFEQTFQQTVRKNLSVLFQQGIVKENNWRHSQAT